MVVRSGPRSLFSATNRCRHESLPSRWRRLYSSSYSESNMSIRFLGLVTPLLLVLSLPGLGRCNDFAFFHENVLGTSLELRIKADTATTARQAEAYALGEVDRLSAIYSHYDPASEFSRFLKTPVGRPASVSGELTTTLRLCDHWRTTSSGAFNPAVEALTKRWQQAASDDVRPNRSELRSAVTELRRPHWRFDNDSGGVVRTSEAPLSLNAIAKGVILDRVATSLLESVDGVNGVMLNIGGDIRVAGEMSAQVSIADPKRDAIGGRGIDSLRLTHGAVATSGRSERRFEVGEETYSHIIDPRNGQPVSTTVSATVLAPEASTADAIATICSVLTIDDSLRLVDSLVGVECMLVTVAGVAMTSANWPQSAEDDSADVEHATAKEAKKTGHEMLVEFEIAKPANSRRYRRPYVGVWIEDKDGLPVKTLSLFLMQKNPGPRWYRDLRRWYADDQMRRVLDETDLISTVSKPTRNPGKYKVSWDGQDDAGKLLADGEYTLLIESAREHGSYQLIRHKFKLGESFNKQLKPNQEISAASVSYKAD